MDVRDKRRASPKALPKATSPDRRGSGHGRVVSSPYVALANDISRLFQFGT